jgi:hypothetical protein
MKRPLSRRKFLETAGGSVAGYLGGQALQGSNAHAQALLGELLVSHPVTDPAQPEKLLDIAAFARSCSSDDPSTLQVAFDYRAGPAGKAAVKLADGRYVYGLQWAEERDIHQVVVHFARGSAVVPAKLEYWFQNWPYPAPRMPSTEDPADDPWQGKWLEAATKAETDGHACCYRFLPLEEYENPNANNGNLANYRRTLKMRLVFASAPEIEKVEVFSGSGSKPVEFRVELGVKGKEAYQWRGKVMVYNGVLTKSRLWKESAGDYARGERFQVTTHDSAKGLILSILTSHEFLPGSNDNTVVTIEAGDRTFSFDVADLEKGPIYVPNFDACVTVASDVRPFAPPTHPPLKIREMLALEPEQSYERASKEIPPLDPVHRQGPGPLYLPLALDASWQKFAFEWGGHVHISKIGTKAKGAEERRLEWPEDTITWRVGTGLHPTFRPETDDSKMSILEDYLPVPTVNWSNEGIRYSEEAFATALSGPVEAEDPGRNEGTPSVLMVQFKIKNTLANANTSHLWFGVTPSEPVEFKNGTLLEADRQLVRAFLRLPDSSLVSVTGINGDSEVLQGLHIATALPPDGDCVLTVLIPFIPGLTPGERAQMEGLKYEDERKRVVDYWRGVVAHAMPFALPETRFVSFAKASLIHTRITATKDPQSGLYIHAPASYDYMAFVNEIGYQCIALDGLGDQKRSGAYLEAVMALQGTVPLPGTFKGDQNGVYNGMHIADDRDYTHGGYNIHHGVGLWSLGEHYFFTRDAAWLRAAAPSMKRAADWVIEQRRLTRIMDGNEKVAEYGILPAGHLEDNADWANWFTVDAYAMAGLTRLAQALSDIQDADAGHYTEEARAYREDLRNAIVRASRLAPVVRLRNGNYVPYVPTHPHQRFRLFGPNRVGFYSRYGSGILPCFRLSATREVLAGPMNLLSAGVFESDERIADWILDDWEENLTLSSPLGLNVHGWVDDEFWFSRGGMCWESNIQNPALTYLRRGEAPAAIRQLYNDFTASIYPDVNTFTEEYREWRHASGPFYKCSDEMRFVNWLRDSLVLEKDKTLWLTAGAPRRWFAPGETIELQEAPTYFGPVSYKIEGKDSSVQATVQLPTRNPFEVAWWVVRHPARKRIRDVEIDGKSWTEFDAAKERVRLPLSAGRLKITVNY